MTAPFASNASQPMRLAIVGFGAAAQAFVPAIQANPAFELAAIVESKPEVQVTAKTLGVPVFSQLHELQQVPNLVGVYIATPTPCHEKRVYRLRSIQSSGVPWP